MADMDRDLQSKEILPPLVGFLPLAAAQTLVLSTASALLSTGPGASSESGPLPGA